MKFESELSEDRLLNESIIRSVNEWTEPITDDDVRYAETVSEFKHSIQKKIMFFVVFVVLAIVASIYNITIGPFDISFTEVYTAIWDRISNQVGDSIREINVDYIVNDIRGPRVVVGLATGAALAVCGVVMQGVMKNPLADPYTTGVSSGASLGATIVMTTGLLGLTTHVGIVSAAFVFSLIPIVIIVLITKISNASPTTMIMAGIGTMYVFNAITTVLMLWADPRDLAAVYNWQVGSISTSSWEDVPIIIVVTLIGILITQFCAEKMNVLATGDESAKALGINAERFRILMLVLTGLLSAVIVSFTGLIGFVGLVTPHIARMFVGANNRFLIPGSAVLGAFIVLLADCIGRIALPSAILPVGVVMSFVGGPVFIWLLLRRSNRAW